MSSTLAPPKTAHIAELSDNLDIPAPIALELYYIFGPAIYNPKSRVHISQGHGVALAWKDLLADYTERFGGLNPTQARALRTAASLALASIRGKKNKYGYSLVALNYLRRDDALHEQIKVLRLSPPPQPSVIGTL